MPVHFDSVFVTSTGRSSGRAGRQRRDRRYIAPLSRFRAHQAAHPGRERHQHRHYAIDEHGDDAARAAMAAAAIAAAWQRAVLRLRTVDCCAPAPPAASAMPGFANMVQGELPRRPMDTSSHHGVCAAAWRRCSTRRGRWSWRRAAARWSWTSEVPSRLFKRSRFAPRGYDIDFDAHFLRWMLSDGAGAWLLEHAAAQRRRSLRLQLGAHRSFTGDYPVCMQVGLPPARQPASYLDYASFAAAEADGAFLLRQDIRLLPNLFDIGIHEYVRLVGTAGSTRADRPLPVPLLVAAVRRWCEELHDKAGLDDSRERWYSNSNDARQHRRGVDLRHARRFPARARAEARRAHPLLRAGVGALHGRLHAVRGREAPPRAALPDGRDASQVLPPHDPPRQRARCCAHCCASSPRSGTTTARARGARRMVRRSRAADSRRRLPALDGGLDSAGAQGSLWMRKAVSTSTNATRGLAQLVRTHAGEEQYDYRILFDDYRRAGGARDIEELQRNPGGEALNAYLHARASSRIRSACSARSTSSKAPASASCRRCCRCCASSSRLPGAGVALPRLSRRERRATTWRAGSCRRDRAWTRARRRATQIVDTARATAELYLMQLEHVR